MRRLLALTSVATILALLAVVAPALVRPDANRAEALVTCNGTFKQTIAQHDVWVAKVLLCVEVLGDGVRQGAKVYCGTASTQVPCNWDFDPHQLFNELGIAVAGARMHETGKTGGDYMAVPNWTPRADADCAHYDVFSETLAVRVRFPDGYLTDWKRALWQGYGFVPC
jgi:hypothetical protein